MTDKICYTSPFIKEVVLRIDFPTPLNGVSESISPKLTKTILNIFPIPEPQTVQAQELQFSGNGFQASTQEIKQWVYHGREREKSLIIEKQSFVITVRKYKAFEDLFQELKTILDVVFEENKDLVSNRVGLRYVNSIDVNDPNPLEWSEYVNEKILGIIDFHDTENLTRAFHILEFNFDGQSLKYQFGIANPDYPALIRQKQFVLDLDSYFNGAFEQKEIYENIETSHTKIQELFEQSITDKSRELMGSS